MCGKQAEKPLLHKPILDGVQATLKKSAQKLSYRKCRAVDIQPFCPASICAGLFMDYYAGLFSDSIFTDGVPGA